MKKFKSKYDIILKLSFLLIAILSTMVVNNLFTTDVIAEDDKASMFVTPMSQKIILTPGETYTGIITVANGSSSTANLVYSAEIGPYSPTNNGDGKDDYGGFDITTVTNRNIMTEWISLDTTKGLIEPNGKNAITFTIKVPENAPAGAQYASMLIRSESEDIATNNSKDKSSAGISSKYQLASVIYANVAGETVEKASIKSNDIPSMLTTNNLEATSMVRNDGNIYTDATYTLQVWPMFSDEEICTNEESAESSIVLPNTERYHVQTCDLPSVGIFKAKQVVKIFEEESILEKTIFVCPIWLMVLVLIIVVAIIVGIIVYIKKHRSTKETD